MKEQSQKKKAELVDRLKKRTKREKEAVRSGAPPKSKLKTTIRSDSLAKANPVLKASVTATPLSTLAPKKKRVTVSPVLGETTPDSPDRSVHNSELAFSDASTLSEQSKSDVLSPIQFSNHQSDDLSHHSDTSALNFDDKMGKMPGSNKSTTDKVKTLTKKIETLNKKVTTLTKELKESESAREMQGRNYTKLFLSGLIF